VFCVIGLNLIKVILKLTKTDIEMHVCKLFDEKLKNQNACMVFRENAKVSYGCEICNATILHTT